MQQIYKIEYRFAEGAKTQVTVQAETREQAIAIAGEQVRARFKERRLTVAEVYRAPLEKRWLRIRSGVPMRSAFGAVCCHAWMPLALMAWQEMASMALVLFVACLVGWSIWRRVESRKALRPISREEAGKIYEAITRARFISGDGKMILPLWDLLGRRNWYGKWAWVGGEKELADILCGKDARYVGGFRADDFKVKELMEEHLREVLHALDLHCPEVEVFSAYNSSPGRVVIVAPDKVECRYGIACHAWLPLALMALPEGRWDWAAWLAMGLGFAFAVFLVWVLVDTLRGGSGWTAEEETDLEREVVPVLPGAPLGVDAQVREVQRTLFISWLLTGNPISVGMIRRFWDIEDRAFQELVDCLMERHFVLDGVQWQTVQYDGPFGRTYGFEVVAKGGAV